jgi:nucleoside permease NupC
MKGVSGLEPSAVYVICSVYVLSIIIVYSTAIAILYYLGAMQLIMYDSVTIET